MEKLKILLGAYVDSVNAQNINCKEIAKRLDQNKFEVHVLVHDKPMDVEGVVSHKIGNSFLLKNLGKLYTMIKLNADIYYLPRVEKVDILFSKLRRKKSCVVSSIEITSVYQNEEYKKFFNEYIFDYFCISEFLNDMNKKEWGSRKKVLYLGISEISKNIKPKVDLNTIAFVGSVEERKRPMEFAKLAKQFPNIQFVMIGSGSLLEKVRNYKKDNNVSNLRVTGKIDNNKVIEELKNVDLLLLLSKAEGLPKVVLEAASVAVPSVYINEYYSIDYIKSGENGIAVRELGNVGEIISFLKENPQKYSEMSCNALKIVPKYTWDALIKDYEEYFIVTKKKYSQQILGEE